MGGSGRPWRTASKRRATTWPSSTPNAAAFRRLGSAFEGTPVTGIGFDRDTLSEARHRGGLRLRRRQQRRQLQHPRRPGRPRDLRRRERRGPHLRPGPRRGLPAARHPHGRHRPLDRRPDAAPAAAPGLRAGADRPQRHVSSWPRCRSTRRGSGAGSPRSRSVTGARIAFLTRLGEGCSRGQTPCSRTATSSTSSRRSTTSTGSSRSSTSRRRPTDVSTRDRRGNTDARRHRRSRQRRALHRPRAARTTATRCCSSTRTPTTSRRPRPRRGLAAGRRLRDRLARGGRLHECDVVVAATGDDKVNLVVSLLAKTEFGVPRTVARVNNPKNEWMFDEAWGVDVAVSTPRLMTALVEEAVSVGDLVRIFTVPAGQRVDGRADAAGRESLRRQAGRRTSSGRTTPRWSASSATAGRSPPAATTRSRPTTSCCSSPRRTTRTSSSRCSPRAHAPRGRTTSGAPVPRRTLATTQTCPRSRAVTRRTLATTQTSPRSRAVTRRTLATTQSCPGSGCCRAVQAGAGLASGSSSGVLPLSSSSPMTSTASR